MNQKFILLSKLDFAIENLEGALQSELELIQSGTLPMNGEIKEVRERIKKASGLIKTISERLNTIEEIDGKRREFLETLQNTLKC